MNNSVRARCRLILDFDLVAIVCVALAALFLSLAIGRPPRDNDNSDWFSLALMFAFFGATPLYWLVARRRGCIEFDAQGARWRTALGAWKSARWDEIESCDARINASGGKTTRWKFVVATRRGAFSWTSAFEKADELAPLAARFCPRVPADLDDWPRRFGYRSSENFLGALVLPIFGAWLFAPIVSLDALRHWPANLAVYAALYGWPLTLFGVLLLALALEAIPVLLLFLYGRSALNYWRHRDETLEATTRGLSWSVNGRERLFAAWDELQTLHIEARGPLVALPFYRLQSARGEFRWNSGLCGRSAFAATLFERAPQLQREVQTHLRESLSAAPDGETLRFDFKTRSLRALLSLGVFMSVITVAMAIYGAIYGPIPPRDGSEPMPTWAMWIFALGMIAFTSRGVWIFARAEIRLSEHGIEWRVPFRKRSIEWESIEDLRVEKGLFVVTGAQKIPLYAASLPPAHLGRLLEIIEERAINARGGWENAAKTTGEPTSK